ncbi:LLM class flavin-dependent oxidoreductase [Aerococcus kribbianus]|uniref:LLM class flavin-dependent oxidoreductase n=1 Tax=Aerococcus kribbianus TaxID=2999064 RepID=A0A9X3FMT7_9LACT|nr:MULTISPECIES: LLM class flavin-dependent oxidoreductase [unclassified Aerococcus]MCZ0717447.1 LLM class flavin-dependent oxidoreductase [Aerococcus sp. YH-aer221]MCZ0725735.1 LLM class flavin-dependent oxidoreductase [Aerococcus sp. YH-aer222]
MTSHSHILPTIDTSQGIEIGLYTLGDHLANPHTGERISTQQRISEIIEMGILAEEAGLDLFQIGESHQEYFVSQAHLIILSAIAQATKRIKLTSGATIISTADPVRVFEDAATIDHISKGRMELVAGRASRVGLYDLLGYDLKDYEALFEEKFDLLLQINENKQVSWQGEFRAPLNDAHVLPRSDRQSGGLPIWRAVGGSLGSAQKAGLAGVPMYQAHLGGPVSVFKRPIDLYREAAAQAGWEVDQLPVATAGFLYLHEDTKEAYRQYYPHINEGMKRTNGQGFPKRGFAQGMDVRSIINVGDPELIIDKLLYQHEAFGMQRYVGQIDFGGVPMDAIKRTIDLLGEKVVPVVKKYTAKK